MRSGRSLEIGRFFDQFLGATMTEIVKADICVIGGGSAGLSIAAGAAQMGARTVLVEAHRMGGDCLNTGCVPSKSLLASAKVAHTARSGQRYGVAAQHVQIDYPTTARYVQSVIDGIAPHDSVERFEGLGCKVIQGACRIPRSPHAQGRRDHHSGPPFRNCHGKPPVDPEDSGLDRVPSSPTKPSSRMTFCPRTSS